MAGGALVVALKMRTVSELQIGIGQIIDRCMAGDAEGQRRDCIGVHHHRREFRSDGDRSQVDWRYRISLDIHLRMAHIAVFAGVVTHHAAIRALLLSELCVRQLGPILDVQHGPEPMLGSMTINAQRGRQGALLAVRKPVTQEAGLHERKHRAIPKVRRRGVARGALHEKMRAVTEPQTACIALAERRMAWRAFGSGDHCGQVDYGINHTPTGNRREHKHPKCNKGG